MKKKEISNFINTQVEVTIFAAIIMVAWQIMRESIVGETIGMNGIDFLFAFFIGNYVMDIKYKNKKRRKKFSSKKTNNKK